VLVLAVPITCNDRGGMWSSEWTTGAADPMRHEISALILLAFLAAAAIALYLLATCVRFRHRPGALAVGAVQLAVVTIAIGSGLLLDSTTSWWAHFWYYTRVLGYALGPPAVFAVTLEVADRRSWLSPPILFGISALPAVTVAVVLFAPFVFAQPEFFQEGGLTYWTSRPGPWFDVHVTYSQALLLASLALLLDHAWRTTGAVRRRSLIVAGAALAPLSLDVVTRVVSTPPVVVLMATSWVFVLTGLLLAWAMFRHRLVVFPPLASDIFDAVPDPIFVTNDEGKLVVANEAFRRLFGIDGHHRGELLPDAVPAARGLPSGAGGAGQTDGPDEVWVDHPHDGSRAFLISMSRHRSPEGEPLLARVMLDITSRKRVEEERDRLIVELQAALAQVKTLQGFIPICSACRKVRNDEGYWLAVEEFVREQTDAQFSHGLCGDCAPSYFPDEHIETTSRA
jgi:hypothetical protein